MKIVITGGKTQSEYLIKMYQRHHNEIIVINSDEETCKYLVETCDIPVFHGNPWHRYVLEESNIYDADLFIALSHLDADNFAACDMAKKIFNVRKCICIVSNPLNVEIYKTLGIDSVISSTYLLAQSIESEASISSLVKTLSLDNDRIAVSEFTVLSKHRVCNKKIRDLHFPNTIATISAIKRGNEVLIPNGELMLHPKDVLLIVSVPAKVAEVTAFLQQAADPSEVVSSVAAEVKEAVKDVAKKGTKKSVKETRTKGKTSKK